jgi:hypothetical protein
MIMYDGDGKVSVKGRKNIAFSSMIAYNRCNRTPRTSHFSDVSHGEAFFIWEFYYEY